MKPLIVSGPSASGKSTLIRKIADAHGVPVMAAPRSVNEYEAMWRRLDNGDTVVFDDWSGIGRLHRDLQLISAGMSTKWRRTGTCDKVDEFHPNGWIVVALRSSAREVDLGALRDKCEFLTARKLLACRGRGKDKISLHGAEDKQER